MADTGRQNVPLSVIVLLAMIFSLFPGYIYLYKRPTSAGPVIRLEKPSFIMNTNYFNRNNTGVKHESVSSSDLLVTRKNGTKAKIAELFPEMDIYLRMTSGKPFYYYYRALLTRSMKYFWPGNVTMVVVLDNESANDHQLGKKISNEYPFPRISFMEPIDPEIYNGRGHQRMQRDFFYPEKVVTRPYVGFVDTDTVFVTRVTRNLLFEDDKPVVIGIYGEALHEWWANSSKVTATIFKSPEPFKCMSYFPVIIKVRHIIELRNYLEKMYDMPFDELFKTFAKSNIAQFNIICKYIWDFHRNEYNFYLHLRPSDKYGRWSGDRNGGGRHDLQYYRQVLTQKQTVPKPRASIHYPYQNDFHLNTTLQRVLRSGICYSGGFDICPEKCSKFKPDGLHKDLFVFEWSDWTWDTRCLTEQIEHYKQIKAQSNSELREIIRKGCHEIDYIDFRPIIVEQVLQ
ncbi:hypothetical protein ACJMK2_040372 [Sinanodonta woodiana]|uniref:Uncharacterized protein n=1 Tax=Sinanodonta woodiana TaxID=1069815 RepID=A0ABD3WFU4_SINWO